MTEVGILTASRTDNIGTNLQAYAMQTILQNAGIHAELIDYKCPKLEKSRKLLTPFRVKQLLYYPIRKRNAISYERFRKKFFRRSDIECSSDTLETLGYRSIIVGSDQIWNLKVTGNDLSFFLPFSNPDIKKYAYAASLGTQSLEEWEQKYHLSKLLSDFKTVSVREQSGVTALKRIGIEAQHDLDPLMMVQGEEWLEIMNHRREHGFVFLYLVEPNEKAVQFAKEYAASKKATVLWYTNSLKKVSGIHKITHFDICDWLYYISNADMVVTNSYHGLAMAVVFHRNVRLYDLKNNSVSNTRMIDLVKSLKLEGILDDGCGEVDWLQVEDILCRRRESSFGYLTKIRNELNEE